MDVFSTLQHGLSTIPPLVAIGMHTTGEVGPCSLLPAFRLPLAALCYLETVRLEKRLTRLPRYILSPRESSSRASESISQVKRYWKSANTRSSTWTISVAGAYPNLRPHSRSLRGTDAHVLSLIG